MRRRWITGNPVTWFATNSGARGVCGRSDDEGRDELPECCPTRVSRSRTRSCSCVIVARCSAIVARSSTTSACKVATTDGITQQNVQRNPPGTLPRHDPVNGYGVGPFVVILATRVHTQSDPGGFGLPPQQDGKAEWRPPWFLMGGPSWERRRPRRQGPAGWWD